MGEPSDKQRETVRSNRVTSSEVAAKAGVSQSAVSRTYTPGASVADETRAKVMSAARALGYRPNAIARTLISGRSRIIGLLVGYLDNQFYPIVVEQLSRRLQAHGYHTLLFITDMGNQDRELQNILQYQVEGVIMASATLSMELAKECADANIPVVLFNRYIASTPVSSVTSDNIEGGRAVAHFLVEAGHKRIAFIAGAEDSSTNRDRESGFFKGLAEKGTTPIARATAGFDFAKAAEATRSLFRHGDAPDAIFVANDHMAFSVLDTLRNELGIKVPEEVSIVGYDDVPQAAWKAYDLTTVSQPAELMIESTVEILLEQIANRAVVAQAAVLPARLVIRSTTRRRI